MIELIVFKIKMSAYFYIVNIKKQDYYYPGDLVSGNKEYELLFGLSGHALTNLIFDSDLYKSNSPGVCGRWAGDPIYAVGDDYIIQSFMRYMVEMMRIFNCIRLLKYWKKNISILPPMLIA